MKWSTVVKLYVKMLFMALIALQMVACAGVSPAQLPPAQLPPAIPIGAQAAVTGVKAVLAGQTGTFIMRNGDMFVFAWPTEGTRYAYLFIGRGVANIQGMKAATFDVVKMVKYLEAGGWVRAYSWELPAAIAKWAAALSAELFMTTTSLTTVWMVPLVIDPSGGIDFGLPQQMEQ